MSKRRYGRKTGKGKVIGGKYYGVWQINDSTYRKYLGVKYYGHDSIKECEKEDTPM